MPRPLSAAARQKAIAATQELVAKGGLDNFTMDGVAKLSGVAKTTLYRHWSSSSELLVHALDCSVEQIPIPNTGTLRGDLAGLLHEMCIFLDEPGNRELVLEVHGMAARDPDFSGVNDAMMHERKRPIYEIVQRAIERGEIPAIELDLACMLVEGPFHSRLLMSAEPIQQAEGEALVTFVARGLGSPDPT